MVVVVVFIIVVVVEVLVVMISVVGRRRLRRRRAVLGVDFFSLRGGFATALRRCVLTHDDDDAYLSQKRGV